MIESGQQFGLYVIKEVLNNSDGMVCCCAEDPFFNREVVLKVYSEEQFIAGDKLEQLEALLERLSVLDHPSIAPIYDSGLEEGYLYFTSACYVGENLAQRLTEPLAVEQALKITVELTQALAFAFTQEHEHGELNAEKVFFAADGQAVIVEFGLEHGLSKIVAADFSVNEQKELSTSVPETLRSLGWLLLHMLIGPAFNADERIDEQLARIKNTKIRSLVGRFLLPDECRFASFTELLEELTNFGVVSEQPETITVDRQLEENISDTPPTEPEVPAEDQSKEMVTEIRRLVAEKNGLQQALDKALYERNVAGNKQAEVDRRLRQAKLEIIKAKEEADVAWELVAGQKYARWRPVTWAIGGFVIGFLLSGSYGYYYSEQTRNELLAKLKANEELIKAAAWRLAEPVKGQTQAVTVAVGPKGETTNVIQPPGPDVAAATTQNRRAVMSAEDEVKDLQQMATPVAEKAKHWWPAGNEFSVSAAIPIEQIRAALGLESGHVQGGLSEVLRREVLATVQGWAESWAKQDLANYFSFYSQRYRPELGRSLQEWRAIRQSRLNRPEWIELDIDNIQVRKVGEDRIQVKMKQSYRSDYYQDEIFKSINLIKEDGQWRILMERSLGMVGTNDLVGG